MFECRHKSKFRLSWLGATEAPTEDICEDTDAGWFSLELITFNSVVDNNTIIYDGEIYVEEEILRNSHINPKLEFLISGVVNSSWPFLALIKETTPDR